MAEDTKKKPSRLARAWRSLTRERVLAEMGPLYLARSPWPHMLIGWALAAVAIYMILSARPLFPLEDTEALGIWFSPGFLIALAVVIGLLFSIRFKFGGKGGFLFSTLLLAAMPFAAYYMVEFLNGYEAYEREPEIVFLNIVAYALVYLFFLVVFGNYRWAVVFGTGLLYVFAVTCYFVLQFRGTPFVPLDIFSGGTAANVADNYVFEITPRWAIVTVQAGLLMGVRPRQSAAHALEGDDARTGDLRRAGRSFCVFQRLLSDGARFRHLLLEPAAELRKIRRLAGVLSEPAQRVSRAAGKLQRR